MGYRTHVTGEIRLDPPIPWGEVKDSLFLAESLDDDQYGWPKNGAAVKLWIETSTEETNEGTLTRRQATKIVPAGEDRYKCHDVERELQQLVNSYRLVTEGLTVASERRFTGRLEGEGERADDIWRLSVVDGKATMKKARIVWDN